MAVLDTLKAAVQASLVTAQNAQAQANAVVEAHTALLAVIEQAQNAAPSMEDLQAMVGKMVAAGART